MVFSDGYQGELRRELWALLQRLAQTDIMDMEPEKNRPHRSLHRDLAALEAGKLESGRASA